MLSPFWFVELGFTNTGKDLSMHIRGLTRLFRFDGYCLDEAIFSVATAIRRTCSSSFARHPFPENYKSPSVKSSEEPFFDGIPVSCPSGKPHPGWRSSIPRAGKARSGKVDGREQVCRSFPWAIRDASSVSGLRGRTTRLPIKRVAAGRLRLRRPAIAMMQAAEE